VKEITGPAVAAAAESNGEPELVHSLYIGPTVAAVVDDSNCEIEIEDLVEP
jgi:hypothetical protein